MSKVQSWEVSDEFWKRVEPLIPPPPRKPADQYQRRPGAGRPRKDPRLVFEAIVYVLRTGCHWRALPAEFGSGSAIHAYFLKWEAAGFFEKLWQAGLAEYDDLKGIAWRWQSIDGSMMKAPLAQEAVGKNPTDRGKKNGSKRHLLVDSRGAPLSLTVTGANRQDVTQLEAVLKQQKMAYPPPVKRRSKHLCADAAYRGEAAKATMERASYIPHVQSRGWERRKKQNHPNYRPRRWIVEVAHSWFNRFRKLLVRYEKLERSFRALHCLAAAIIVFRKIPVTPNIIYG